MKSKIIFLLLFSCAVSSAQSIFQGIIKDSETNEPVPFASVAIKNTSTGTVTNEEGQFRLSAIGNTTIIISSIGYSTKEISVESIKQGNIILLKPDSIKLDEITITNVPLYEMLNGLIKASLARFDKQAVYNTYYREFVSDNDNITKFSDGLLDYSIDATGKKAKSSLSVKQNRSAQVFSKDDEEIFKDFDTDIDVQNGILYGRLGIIYKNIIKAHENYTFTINTIKSEGNDSLRVMVIKPKDNVKKPLLEGSVVYNPDSKLIYEVELHYAPSHVQYAFGMNILILNYKILDFKYIAKYRIANGAYIPAYISLYQKFKFWTKKIDETLEYKSDLIVTDFSTTTTESFKNEELYKKKRLYEKPSAYTEKFWQQNNAIVLTAKEEELIRKLEEGNIAVK